MTWISQGWAFEPSWLAPDFKTIADFRKDHPEAIRLVCREFVMLCKKLNLLSEKLVAIDGSKFKAVLDTNKLTVVADKGYYNGDELRECEKNDIVAYVAKPKAPPNKTKGYFDRSRFKYIREDRRVRVPGW